MKSIIKILLIQLFIIVRRLCHNTLFYKHLKRIYYSIFNEELNKGKRLKYLCNYLLWHLYFKPLKKTFTIKLQNNMLSLVYPDSDSGESNIFTKNVDYYENQFIRKHLQSGTFIIDAGCNVGNRTLVLADIINGGLLIDANQECLNRLIKNFKFNKINLGNYHLVNKAVGSKCTTVFFTNYGGTSCKNRINNINSSDKIKVVMTTIDNEMKKIGNPPCSFIKFDLEGYDLDGIKGAINTIKMPTMKFIKFERWTSIPLDDFEIIFSEINWTIFAINSKLQVIQNKSYLIKSMNLFACPQNRLHLFLSSNNY